MAIATEHRPQSPAPARRRARLWCPRIWEGCTLGTWIRLLARNRFRVGWRQLYLPPVISAMSVTHSALRVVQNLFLGRRIRATEIRQPPIFILGHWRTGTTLLHEFMVLDERHAFPTAYECFEPYNEDAQESDEIRGSYFSHRL